MALCIYTDSFAPSINAQIAPARPLNFNERIDIGKQIVNQANEERLNFTATVKVRKQEIKVAVRETDFIIFEDMG